MEPNAGDNNRQEKRPYRVLLAWPVSSNLSAAVLLIACFWMPQAKGCSGQILRPSTELANGIAGGEAFTASVLFWPHIFGLFVGIALVAGVLACILVNCHAAVLGLVVSHILFWMLVPSLVIILDYGDDYQLDSQSLLMALPIFLILSWWWLTAIYHRDLLTAWARLVTSQSIAGIIWVYVSYLFIQAAYYGLFLTYGALLLLAILPWGLRSRWDHLLVDDRLPSRPPKFKTAHLLAIMTLFGLLYAYYRYLPALAQTNTLEP